MQNVHIIKIEETTVCTSVYMNKCMYVCMTVSLFVVCVFQHTNPVVLLMKNSVFSHILNILDL